LENAIERAVVLGSTELIVPEDLPEAVLESTAVEGGSQATYYEAINEAKRQLVTKTLQQTDGNYTEAAKLLGIHPNNLHRIIRSLNLKTTLRHDG
jgi:DNA-binding NtrC family response regulator